MLIEINYENDKLNDLKVVQEVLSGESITSYR